MVGTVVRHPKYGRGKVLKDQNSGYRLYVEFEFGKTTWVYGYEVDSDSSTKLRKVNSEQNVPKAVDPSFVYRRMIEAFRLGIVPYDRVEHFTFGRDREIEGQLRWLENSEEGTNVIQGQYGSGKTHLAHYLYWRALREGYAVANVELDPGEVPLDNPKKVYNRLVQNFRFPVDGTVKGFRDFIRSALNKGALKDHIYFKHIKLQDNDIEHLWNWIEGSDKASRPVNAKKNNKFSQLPSMPPYGTAANIYCNLLSTLSWVAKNHFGLKGLLITFDEAEVIDMVHYKYQEKNAYNFIDALVRLSNNDISLLSPPESTKLNYFLQGPGIPFMYKDSPNLKVSFVFTPNETLDRIYCLEKVKRLQLQPISEEGLEELYSNVQSIYQNAYPTFRPSFSNEQGMYLLLSKAEHTRNFVKGAVELLDLFRLGSDSDKAEIFV